MSKSATEQFQIKKKRKHHKQLLNCKLSCKRSETTALHFAPPANTLIKENFKRLPQENLRLNLKPAICTLPVVNQTRNIKNCLRDQTQVLFCKSRDTVMPLSQGFYVKGAIASKRGLKSMRLNSPNVATAMTSISSMPSVAKKPRRASENMSDRLGQTAASQLTNQLLQGQTTNNLQLSYLLGESLARHGRLQEAFNLYALIASEQPEGFIPLEKLHILATALIEHVRALCLNSRKAEHSEIELMDPITATFTQTKGTNGHKSGNNGSRSNKPLNAGLPTQGWQVVASNLTTRMPAFGGNEEEDTAYDLHSPLRDLSRVSSPFLSEEYDPLLCPLCRDILRSPVTTNCGHTFCRQCCETITMCNVCHIKFPKYQRDDYATETTITKNCISAIAMTTASTITTSTSNISGPVSYVGLLGATNPSFPVVVSPVNTTPPCLRLSSPTSPTTVTTTTVASTTDTPTTTMASTTRANGVVSTTTTSNESMKFMPDVLVRRLVEKWWGSDLQAKKINETAASYMHLHLLDDALKFCNASLEKCNYKFRCPFRSTLNSYIVCKMFECADVMMMTSNSRKHCVLSNMSFHVVNATSLEQKR
uniref:RING-type domain-containing protein n=1 Tax=Glossina brevipalpis TaxID=37001 RepID=A0A1A9W7P6_9MUSC